MNKRQRKSEGIEDGKLIAEKLREEGSLETQAYMRGNNKQFAKRWIFSVVTEFYLLYRMALM
jgi:hypothetical protein